MDGQLSQHNIHHLGLLWLTAVVWRLLPLTPEITCLYILKHLASFQKAHKFRKKKCVSQWNETLSNTMTERQTVVLPQTCPLRVFYDSTANKGVNNKTFLYPREDYNYKLACLHPIKMFPRVYSPARQPWSLAMIITAGYSTSPLRRESHRCAHLVCPKDVR